MTRTLLGLGAAALLTSACLPDSTGPECVRTPLSVVETRGDTVVLNSGLRYIEEEAGTGASVEYCDYVVLEYTGTYPDGVVFDPGRIPVDFTTGFSQVIPGFEQGVIGMQLGGTRRIILPPALGYGPGGVVNPTTGDVVIRPNATLVFDVELVGHDPR